MANTDDGKTLTYSRSALAEELGLTLKEVTQHLIESGWILQQNSKWVLTAKGEFEGGEYRQSSKYGQYIVWPQSVIDHPAIVELKNTRLTASIIAKHFNLTAALINRLLAEAGLLKAYAKGWKLTLQGEQVGGLQQHHADTGIPFVTWQRTILKNSSLLSLINNIQGDGDKLPTENSKRLKTIDGHYVSNEDELAIANWLYLSAYRYCYHRTTYFGDNKSLISDYYLSDFHVHILYQPEDVSPEKLAKQLQRRELYKKAQLHFIEILPSDVQSLEKILPKFLLQLGLDPAKN